METVKQMGSLHAPHEQCWVYLYQHLQNTAGDNFCFVYPVKMKGTPYRQGFLIGGTIDILRQIIQFGGGVAFCIVEYQVTS